jgi:septal ring factor EnvC (AmiA/AmiB activator)
MQYIDQLKSRLHDLEVEMAEITDRNSALIKRRAELRGEIDTLDVEISKATWQTRNELNEQRRVALIALHEVDSMITAVSHQSSPLSLRISDTRREIARLEYESVSLDDLQAASKTIASEIAGIDARVAALSAERDNLGQKRTEAEAELELLANAEEELQLAREAMEKAQGEAFISGAKADLSALTTQLARAEKHLASARNSATAAQAALSRIDERLSEVEGAIAELEGERAIRTADWWDNRARQADSVYRMRVRDLVEVIRDRVAIDKRIGSNIGWQLLQGAREALRVPVLGRGTEPVNLASWFGPNFVPEVSDTADRIEREFTAEIATES